MKINVGSMTSTSDIKRIDISEFRKKGFLQELNRTFLHPLGMALEVIVHEDESETLGGRWDYRNDTEGMSYADGVISQEKVNNVLELWNTKTTARRKNLGYVVQDK